MRLKIGCYIESVTAHILVTACAGALTAIHTPCRYRARVTEVNRSDVADRSSALSGGTSDVPYLISTLSKSSWSNAEMCLNYFYVELEVDSNNNIAVCVSNTFCV